MRKLNPGILQEGPSFASPSPSAKSELRTVLMLSMCALGMTNRWPIAAGLMSGTHTILEFCNMWEATVRKGRKLRLNTDGS